MVVAAPISPAGEGGPALMFFGIGAMKAGTSWVHRYLAGHPQVSAGALKEYHYFNKFHREFGGAGDHARAQTMRRGLAAASAWRRSGRRGALGAMRRPDAAYRTLVRGPNMGARAFGDITPIYSLLGREAFAEMAAFHPRTRFFFIMRDPVDRLWSHARMRARRLGIDPSDRDRLIRMARGLLDKSRFVGRSDYARTITELEAAVPQSDILYLFYETLFTDDSLGDLCAFLGLDFRPGDYRTRVYEGPSAEPPADWVAAAREILDPVYDFTGRRFGDTVPAAWFTERVAHPAAGTAPRPARPSLQEVRA